jgi:hypothetical protein
MEANPNPNLSPAITHQPSLLGGAENMKLLFDDTMAFLSENRKAYASLQLRAAEDAQTIKHFANLAYLNAQQTGDTANQQTVSPIRTATGDNLVAGAAPANRVVDETGAVAAGAVNSATAQATLGNVTAQLADLTTQVAALAALVSQVVTNAGNAGKPVTA